MIRGDNKMLISGYARNNPHMYYLIQTFPDTISIHYNIVTSNFSFSANANTNYTISTTEIINNFLLVDYPMSNYDVPSLTDTHTYHEFWESDVSYWSGNTSYTQGLQSSSNYEIDINLTCSVSGNTVITYALVSNDNEVVPSWVTLDSSDRKLRLTTPELDADTNFTFSVQATVGGDTNTYVNKYYLEVLRANITNNT